MSLKGKHFLKLLDFTPEEISDLLDLAAELKAKKKSGRKDHLSDRLFIRTAARAR